MCVCLGLEEKVGLHLGKETSIEMKEGTKNNNQSKRT